MWVPSSRRRVSGVLAVPISASGAFWICFFEARQLAGRDPPGGGRLGDREFGQLVEDLGVAQLRLGREFVAEADAVVVDAEHDVQPAVAAVFLLDLDAQLAVVVAHEAALAPGLLPGRIVLGMDRRIRSIVIVGGGTAGWMAAAALKRAVRTTADVTLVESADIGIVGVGEATVPPIRQFNAMIGLDEAPFMRATQASLKLGIAFHDWGAIGDRYFHPFGHYGLNDEPGQFHQSWLSLRAAGYGAGLDDFSVCAVAARRGRMAPPTADRASPAAQLKWAFHFDAALYAKHLRVFCEGLGVERVEGEVVEVALRPQDGFVDGLALKDGRVLTADLFIDCTGFRGLLIEGALQAGYEDWSQWLPVDRAVAAPCAKVGPVQPYTTATADEAGWRWRIPLQHRTGNGYVFSSAFLSEDRAARTLMGHLDGDPLADPRVLRFTSGRRKVSWSRNVVALGLAGGFIEPLESTSIHMVHSALNKLLLHFPDRDFGPLNIAAYNRKVAEEAERIRDFIILHYHATTRADAPFWDHVRTMTIPDSLAERVALFREGALLSPGSDEMFSRTSWAAVLLGQGIVPTARNPLYDPPSKNALASDFERMRREIARAVDQMPEHDAYLAAQGLSAAVPQDQAALVD
jgi:tryptophan halogenase